MPWNNNSGKGNDPWGQTPTNANSSPKKRKTGGGGSGGNSGGPIPPDLDELLKQFQAKFNGEKGLSAGFIALIVFGLWLASGIYIIQPQEQGVIQRFGKYVKTIEQQGLHYRMPWPIETVLRPDVTFERRIEIGFRGNQDRPDESLILTGDANIVDIDFVVQWQVGAAKDFVFNIRAPEETIKKVAESAMREVVGQNNLQSIITERRADVAKQVQTIMQNMLDEYGAGVSISQVLIQGATVPGPVMDAFEDVIRADQDAETMKNQALKYKNDILPRARGNAIKLIKEAEGYKEQVVSKAQGDAQRFKDVYKSYATAKDVTRERLYLETIEEILQNSQKFVLGGKGGNGVLPYLPLNELKKSKDGK